MASSGKPVVLVTGGSGYLGQFLVQALAKANFQVAFTHHSTAAPILRGDVTAYWVDLVSGEGLEQCISSLPSLSAIINTAAISSPGACEKDPDTARAVNVPSKLLDALSVHAGEHGSHPLFIHLSTDQVYDGSRSNWREEEAGNPVNAYGKTKLEAEKLIQERWPNCVILRSSIIYGPQSPTPVSRALFLQFVARQLKEGTPTSFFNDEFRNPVFVDDIVSVVLRLLQPGTVLSGRWACILVYNMGGPERLSRVDMAAKVAEVWGYSPDAIVSAPSSSVNRGVASPADISMTSRKLETELGLRLTPFSEALQQIGRLP
ncbi:methionine adenosyltransferase regulatory beta subunit-related [Coccomyxa subellipsoidea C-169]|uniref:Methionine adenosyltransferase regulatory beta subunit-related n=1 Tax=Coccomyxa subellipsoidea (strain C-169) TaxID=574566 RepID=I0YK20_COCSC|nr:methionine adenosyltransferase regulatory beta subunit-related [Coccomyxa subellipsoidea C-169]EIE18739.1 methionine adenosyltransferase regulatory beta subunit-related [Coccomyxa subellipsoidea C-169]|eukprot:XP_005643283.1 methionine adenosyltransferase regulatory beta subunit-related [Coccomyxa subellipsoidea C-169]